MDQMDPIESAILAAWQRVKPRLDHDPDELARRLARRRLALLQRPPRAWCLAVRASDTRINAATAILSPEGAADLPNPWSMKYRQEHTVVLDARLVRMLTGPVHIDPPGEDWCDVAKRLGCRPNGLRNAWRRGVVRMTKVKSLGGKWGPAVPELFTRDLLDGCSGRLRKPADVVWGTQWQWLCEHVPDDLEQTVERVPIYVRTALARAADAEDREHFIGWSWRCPGCRKLVRIVHYPLPCFRTLRLLEREFPPDHPDALPQRLGGFACHACHRVQSRSRLEPNMWNLLIAHLSGGLLFGGEVPQPACFKAAAERAIRYTPQLNRRAPRRELVLRRLLLGWSVRRIARDLQIGIRGVGNHVSCLCREERVADRHELARKLGSPHPQPLNQDERARARRRRIEHLLLRGYSYAQIIAELETDFSTVNRDAWRIYRAHGVSGRRALARKLGITLPSIHTTRRGRVLKLLLARNTYPQIAAALGVNRNCVHSHARCIYREHGVNGREALIAKLAAESVSREPTHG